MQDRENNSGWQKSTNRQFWKDVSVHRHVLQVYENDQVLLVALNGFARSAISAGEKMIVVATPDHMARLAKSLKLFGIDPDELRFARNLVFIDAADMLGQFMEGGMPNNEKFCKALDNLLEQVGDRGGKPVKIFGEMVAILWERGNHEATMALEEIWNRECVARGIHLFCGYPASLFLDKERGKLLHICGQHSTMLEGTTRTYTEIVFRRTS